MRVQHQSPVGTLASIQVGAIAPLGPKLVASGFVKRAVGGAVAVGSLGLAGDSQADLTVHGGPDKAVYGFGEPAYAVWRAAFPEHAERLHPGSLGENLTLRDMREDDVSIGDVVGIGTAVLQVTQPRQPCFKLALRFSDSRLPAAMVRNARCGWYYRVKQTGVVTAGDAVALLERPNPRWTIERFFRMVTQHTVGEAELIELAEMDGLAEHWRRVAKVSLGRG